jgi:membrane associated rhomboid family serine protease
MTEAQQEPAGDEAQSPRCYRHPNREALIRCTRCDRPICPECMRPASVGFHCPDDVAIGRRTTRPVRTSVGARLRDAPPYVTGTLVAANLVAYLVTGLQSSSGLLGNQYASPPNSLFNRWQLWPVAVGRDGEYWRLITSAFLHINPLHIAANMLALVVIGPSLESLLGRNRFIAVYVLAALGGSAAVYAFGSPAVPVVGASGAIFGLFGASLVMVRKLGLDPQWLIGVIVLNFVFTFSVHGISRLGHLGGFITGAVCAVAIAGLPRMRQRLSPQAQAAGLCGVLGVLLVVVAVRTATGSF